MTLMVSTLSPRVRRTSSRAQTTSTAVVSAILGSLLCSAADWDAEGGDRRDDGLGPVRWLSVRNPRLCL